MHDHVRDLGYQANRLARLLRASMARELDTAGVTPRQAAVLLQLATAPSRPMGELAARMDIDRPTLTGVVDRLERDGWVVCQVNPADKRGRLVSLAARSASIVPQLAEASARAASPAVEALDSGEVEHLLSLMQRAADALDGSLVTDDDSAPASARKDS